ncbi:chondroadherin-like [Branchiostoma lanceolatum]|uniref:chondroadherin-like n=1 Tax=Branchiostoma lanceolatum TaxID=7740 RepID=UPI0034543A41
MAKTLPGVPMFLLVILAVLGAAEADCSCSSPFCNCNNQSLTSVPQDLPTDITSLDLGTNQITTLSQSDFSRYRSLTDLYVDNNRISTINTQAFYYLSNVTIIWFNTNQIPGLRSDMFTGLGSLRSLILWSNNISDIEAGTFLPTPRLRSLSLQSNKLAGLRSDMLAGLRDLQSLYLYDNDIIDIQAGTFNPTPDLRNVYLSNNHIPSIPSKLLANLVQLRSIQLSNNNITEFPFGDLSNIQTISALSLDNNQMTTLPSVAYDILMPVFLVRIQKNPWQCDCRMYDFRLKMTGIYSFEHQINCSQPDHLHGQMLKDINPENLMFDCKEPTIVRFERGDNTLLVHGETLYLVCEASGPPTPDITVTLPSELNVTVSSVGRVTIDVNGVITITNVTAADTGLYFCIAVSPVGSNFATLDVQDIFYEKPTIFSFERIENNVLVQGETFSLVCEASGIPTPDITVIIPSGLNATVESVGRVTVDANGTVIIRGVTVEDEGLYACIAINPAGSAFATLVVQFLQIPEFVPSFSLPVLVGAIFGSVVGILLIGGIILTVWCRRYNKSPTEGSENTVVLKNINTTTTAL